MKRLLLLLAVAAPLSPGIAGAQPLHYQPLTVGSRAMGSATAFTAIADDNSAVFHNPAGLPSRERASISGGLTFRRRDVRVLDDFVVLPSGQARLTLRESASVPNFTASAIRFGRTDAQGFRPHTLGAASFRAYTEAFGAGLTLDNARTGLTDQVFVDESLRSQWSGLSYGYRHSERFQLGGSLFLADTRLAHDELLNLYGGSPLAPGLLSGTRVVTADTAVRLRAYHFVLRLGVMVRPSRRWRLGAMLQTPGVPLKATADVTYQANDIDGTTDPPTASFDFVQASGVPARMPIPWELRVGVAHTHSDMVRFSLDVGVVGAVADRPLLKEAERLTLPLETIAPLLSPTTERSYVGNVAVATHIVAREYLEVSVGVLTDLSSAPRVAAREQAVARPRIHRFGFTTALGVLYSPIELAVSFAALFGRGQATGLAISPEERISDFERTSGRSRTFLLQITGATGTAERVVELGEERFGRSPPEPSRETPE